MHAIFYSPCEDYAVEIKTLESGDTECKLFENVGLGDYFAHDADAIAYDDARTAEQAPHLTVADFLLYTADHLPGESYKSECREAQTLRDWAHSLA